MDFLLDLVSRHLTELATVGINALIVYFRAHLPKHGGDK